MEANKAKKISDSAIEDYTYRIFPNDLNSNGTVFGGLVMSILDRLALVVSEKHCGMTCVTASVDTLVFLAPATIDDHLIFKAAVNRVWNSSLEVGLKVIAENPKTTERRHIVSAYFTFVALGPDQKPVKIGQIVPQTQTEIRRFKEAQIRRNSRFSYKEEIKKERNLN
jgi:acyl-CoA hydrolase